MAKEIEIVTTSNNETFTIPPVPKTLPVHSPVEPKEIRKEKNHNHDGRHDR